MGSATPVHGAHGMSGVPGRKAELWICCGCAQVVTRCQSCSLCHKSCCLAQRSAECSSPQVSLIFLFNHPLTGGTRESTKKTSRIQVQHQGKKHFHPVSLAAAGRMLQLELALSHQLKKSREKPNSWAQHSLPLLAHLVPQPWVRGCLFPNRTAFGAHLSVREKTSCALYGWPSGLCLLFACAMHHPSKEKPWGALALPTALWCRWL